MKINQTLTITGMKASKGTLEDGTPYDSTKVYAITELDESKDMAKGFATVEYGFGKSDEFPKYKHLTFPVKAECEMEFTTNGKVGKMVLHAIKPLAAAKV